MTFNHVNHTMIVTRHDFAIDRPFAVVEFHAQTGVEGVVECAHLVPISSQFANALFVSQLHAKKVTLLHFCVCLKRKHKMNMGLYVTQEVYKENEQLKEKVAQLTAEIAKLEAKLAEYELTPLEEKA